MILFIVGMVSFISILGFAVPSEVRVVFLNLHAMMIVLAGSLAVGAISIRWEEWKAIFHFVSRSIFVNLAQERAQAPQILMELERNRFASLQGAHPMITYAQELWKTGVDPDQFEILLYSFADSRIRTCERASLSLQNLAKYPPSLGMIGTVISLVGLFSQLGATGIKGVLGPSLALAMTATFYGLSLANLILLPLGDRLMALQHVEQSLLQDLRQWLLSIHRGYPLSIVFNKNSMQQGGVNAA